MSGDRDLKEKWCYMTQAFEQWQIATIEQLQIKKITTGRTVYFFV